MDYISDLPRDLIYANILKNVDPKDVFNLCKVLPQLKDKCQTDEFWKEMVQLYYPKFVDRVPSHLSWKQYFEDIGNKIYVLKAIKGKVMYPHGNLPTAKIEMIDVIIDTRMNLYNVREKLLPDFIKKVKIETGNENFVVVTHFHYQFGPANEADFLYYGDYIGLHFGLILKHEGTETTWGVLSMDNEVFYWNKWLDDPDSYIEPTIKLN